MGGEGALLELLGPVIGGGWGPVFWAPKGRRGLGAYEVGFNSPPLGTHTHIHSFLQQMHIYQVLSVPGTVLGGVGWLGEELNEAMT